YSAEIIEEIKIKLKIFVEKKQFLNKNLKLPDVAVILGTNRTTLSYILNDHMNVSFPDYIKLLRINYITNLMLTDKKYLNYKIESLAEMCGMS
ncbi:helix-turn-helix domain-containing protein, partial [Chryseobacterium sp. SIMBA_028]